VTAQTQPGIGASELGVVLALTRAGNLAGAGQQLGVDGSTVFRTVQRAEKALGQRLFERSRSGYRVNELGARLVQHAERIETELEAARALTQHDAGTVSGRVRISTTDTLLHGLLLPALAGLIRDHPHLQLETHASNELANLMQREADIALRATRRPPQHLVGRPLGPIRVALYASKALGKGRPRSLDPAALPWLAVDEALPEHPSVSWRRRHRPQVVPRLLVNSIQSVFEGIVVGAGIGIVPLFMARGRNDLLALTGPLDDAETQLWLLTHPESRHLRRIAIVAAHLADALVLD